VWNCAVYFLCFSLTLISCMMLTIMVILNHIMTNQKPNQLKNLRYAFNVMFYWPQLHTCINGIYGTWVTFPSRWQLSKLYWTLLGNFYWSWCSSLPQWRKELMGTLSFHFLLSEFFKISQWIFMKFGEEIPPICCHGQSQNYWRYPDDISTIFFWTAL